MNTRQQLILLVALSLGALVSDVHRAEAYCTTYQSKGPAVGWEMDMSNGPIPVYLVSPNSTFVGLDSYDVGMLVGRAVDQVNRYGMSNFRLRWMGPLSTLPISAPGIYIAEDDIGSDAGLATPANFGGVIDRVLIRINNNSSFNNWSFHAVNNGPTRDLQATVLHEFIHAAGLDHSGSNGACGIPDNGSMGVMAWGNQDHTEKRYLSQDDIEGLVELYGAPVYRVDYHYSFDGGLSWFDGGVLGAMGSFSPLSSISTATEGEDNLVFSILGLDFWIPLLRSMTSASFSPSEQLDAEPGRTSYHPTAMAQGDGIIMAVRFAEESRTENAKKLFFEYSTNGGASWTSKQAVRNNGFPIRTRRNGLAAAYDPKTQKFIAAYVGDDSMPSSLSTECGDGADWLCDELRVVTMSPSTRQQYVTRLGVRTATAPSIACGNTSTIRNCVITWVETTGDACIHWGHGRILSTGEFELYNDLSDGCYAGFSAPNVTYDANEPLKPWRMTFSQEHPFWDDRVWTLRKATNYNASWNDLNSFVVAGEDGFRILGGVGVLNQTNGLTKLQAMYVRNP